MHVQRDDSHKELGSLLSSHALSELATTLILVPHEDFPSLCLGCTSSTLLG